MYTLFYYALFYFYLVLIVVKEFGMPLDILKGDDLDIPLEY